VPWSPSSLPDHPPPSRPTANPTSHGRAQPLASQAPSRVVVSTRLAGPLALGWSWRLHRQRSLRRSVPMVARPASAVTYATTSMSVVVTGRPVPLISDAVPLVSDAVAVIGHALALIS
jgi:hypothetical protein